MEASMYPVIFRCVPYIMARHGLLHGAFWPWPHLNRNTRTIKARLASTTGIITCAISGHLTRIGLTVKEWVTNDIILNL